MRMQSVISHNDPTSVNAKLDSLEMVHTVKVRGFMRMSLIKEIDGNFEGLLLIKSTFYLCRIPVLIRKYV